MPGNSFGQLFRITTFGESHGPAIGLVIDGCPAGLAVNSDEIQQELDRRKSATHDKSDPPAGIALVQLIDCAGPELSAGSRRVGGS